MRGMQLTCIFILLNILTRVDHYVGVLPASENSLFPSKLGLRLDPGRMPYPEPLQLVLNRSVDGPANESLTIWSCLSYLVINSHSSQAARDFPYMQ